MQTLRGITYVGRLSMDLTSLSSLACLVVEIKVHKCPEAK